MIKDNIIFIDIETTVNGEIAVIGIMDLDNNYYYFTDGMSFYKFLLDNKIKKVYAYNLEFDFFVWYLDIYDSIKKKVNIYTNTFGVVYIRMGNIYFYDLKLHYDRGLRKFGDLIGLPKLKYEYNKIEVGYIPDELIEYNKRDLELTKEMYIKLKNIYNNEGDKMRATISSNSLSFYNKRFLGIDYKKVNDVDLEMWRYAYKGGWNEVFISGDFVGKLFYLIDVNSLYPFVMLEEYPYPYEYEKIENVSKYDYNEIDKKVKNKFWLGIEMSIEDNRMKTYNNEEDIYNKVLHDKLYILYIFPRKLYPFRMFIKYFSKKKEIAEKNNKKFERQIYKRLMNSLYGRFAMKPERERIIFNVKPNDIYKMKNIISYEEIKENVYMIKEKTDNHYEVNVIWSVFTTAKARGFMRRMYDIFTDRGLIIYYTDTDSFICSGDINNIKEYLDNGSGETGKFKIEMISDNINIKGKKLYRFGDVYKVKGIEPDKAKEFFETGQVEVNRMTKWKTAIRIGRKVGSIYHKEIMNISNIDDDDSNPLL